jgi:hypothetical protein
MKLLIENWRKYLNEERCRSMTEQQVKDTFAEHGYLLTEEMLQEIDWKKAKRLINRGIVGLALIGALTGIARPVMGQDQPAGESCSETSCSVEVNIDETEMKSYLAEMIKGLVGDSSPSEKQLKDIYEMVGWQAEWGSYTDYLAPAAATPAPAVKAPSPK